MRRWVLLLSVACLLSVVGTAALVARPLAPPEPLYTPAQFAALHVRSRLQPGQIIRVRGKLQPLWWSGSDSGVIAASDGSSPVGVLVVYGRANPLVTRLRALPFVGRWVPPTADHPLENRDATFRLRVVPCRPSIPYCASSFALTLPFPHRLLSPALQLEDGGSG